MASISRFVVSPKLPEPLVKLMDIANNVGWCWDHEAVNLFFRIDRDLWVETNQNPRALLNRVSQARLEELAADTSFLAHLDRVVENREHYFGLDTWTSKLDTTDDFSIAYFSAEYGVHESVKIYSGGLGVLAGDHLKAASDLGLPLMGIGLLYREGYFRQYLNQDGWQQESYPQNDFYSMPLERMEKDGKPIVIEVEYPGRMVKAYVWRLLIGRVPLYLLDADHTDNAEADREITNRLYGGDLDMRIRQEIMLGMGGVLALHAMDIYPSCFHMNEGHSAFMTLQRIKDLIFADNLTFEQAAESVKAGSLFTTHTPVPAGNDMFEPAMIEYYFKKYCEDVGISMDQLIALGRQNPADTNEPFGMTVLALKLSAGANGVSKLHGQVARNMWNLAWKNVPEHEVPIDSITNGIHTRFWVSRDMAELYDRYLGPEWSLTPEDQSIWDRIDEVPDTELWRMHSRRRERLVHFARRRLVQQLKKRGAPAIEIEQAAEVLDPDTLTIGFARRFATYKRGTLILHDRERLLRILKNATRPVQFIIGGKAHPADTTAKALIRDLIHFAHEAKVMHRLVFIEDYDINVTRYMVQGVDCWLNTPRRPMEASGTSGMKAAANGGLNISIPDGWWVEAESLGANGWSIGHGEMYASTEEQDQVESAALYEILEKDVVPMFYDRGSDDVPRAWMRYMKSAIRTCAPVFNTSRMVQQYAENYYAPFSRRRWELADNKRKRGLALAEWKERIREQWHTVKVVRKGCGGAEMLTFGDSLPVFAEVDLGKLKPEDVTVELYYGYLDKHGYIIEGQSVELQPGDTVKGTVKRFEGALPCESTGEQGFTVRVLPTHPDLAQKFEMALCTWA